MKTVISVRTNIFFETDNSINIQPAMELVIIHTDGKDYTYSKKGLVSKAKFGETRVVVNPEVLRKLIVDLQLHEKKLEAATKNANSINGLVEHIQTQQP